MIHNLKSWPEFFEDVASGEKCFEWRRDDRDYQIGDILALAEFKPTGHSTGEYTGRSVEVIVTYVQKGRPAIGIPSEYCILGIELME